MIKNSNGFNSLYFFFSSSVSIELISSYNVKSYNVLFIDASKECIKITNNNKLTDNNISKIVEVFEKRTDIEFISKLVSNNNIAEKDYNLSVSTYVEQKDTREKIDINSLNKEIDDIVEKEQMLRDEIKKIISEIEVQ